MASAIGPPAFGENKKIGFDAGVMTGKILYENDSEISVSATIAREMVQQYPDGRAYKPADELEKAAWTGEGRWVIPLKHPDTGIIVRREDVAGKMVNVRFVKDIIDPKTRRPIVRGIKADVVWFKSKLTPELLDAIKTGTMLDVSIGFTYEEDRTPGVWEGQEYDYVQRNIFIDHLAAPVPAGRCPYPMCGLTVDSAVGSVRKIGLDPWETSGEYIRSGHKNSADYDPGSIRTITLGEGIKAIVGCPKGEYENGKCKGGMEIISYLFDRAKWTLEKAKEWFEKHKEDSIAEDSAQPCPIVKKINELGPEGFAKRLKETLSNELILAVLNGKQGTAPAAAPQPPTAQEPAQAPTQPSQQPQNTAAPQPQEEGKPKGAESKQAPAEQGSPAGIPPVHAGGEPDPAKQEKPDAEPETPELLKESEKVLNTYEKLKSA